MTRKKSEQGPNYSFPYMREVDRRSKCEKFAHAIWEPSEKKLFGRTGKSWAQLLLFYAIFYTALAALFAISMKGLLSTISDDEPTWKLEESRIGINPGVGFRPISNETDEGSLIWYSAKNEDQIKKWVSLIDEFLKPYYGGATNREVCDFDKPPGVNKVCDVDVKSWNPCKSENSFSYRNSSPCFFIKLNRIYGWIPDVYDDPNNLPSDMPVDLKQHIASLPPEKRKQIWVTCDGEDPVDRELLPPGSVEYIPTRGFPSYYYPYRNTPNYLSPLVAVRLVRPPLNRIINIECRAWAKNIVYVGGNRDREGSVHFEVMVD